MLKAKSVRRLLEAADASIEALQKIIGERRAAQLAAARRLAIPCTKCKQLAPLHRWTFMQDRNYNYPDGPHSGYWSDSDFQYCDVACPRCGTWNRINCREDMVPLLEIQRKYHFSYEKLFDPKIIVGPENNH